MGCSSEPEYYEQMNQLDAPIEIEITTTILFGTDRVWVTHEYALNENEVLYYSPKSIKINGNTYLNDQEQYFIWRETVGFLDSQYTQVTAETLREIFKE